MVKYKPLKENFFKEYFSYLVSPLLNLTRSADPKWAHRYRTGVSSKNVVSYFNRFIFEGKTRQMYRHLDQLHSLSFADLEQQKKQGFVPQDLHPIQEQNWLIEYLRPRISSFNAEDVWEMMVYYGQRERYCRYLSSKRGIDQFEIFLENYFFSALSPQLLVEIFLLIFDAEEKEQTERLEQFLNCLSPKQSNMLIMTLKKVTVDFDCWKKYCQRLIACMRNAQTKNVLQFLPKDLEKDALKKLYPYEVLEVVESIHKSEKKEQIIRIVLENARTWWEDFSHDEVKHTLSILRTQ